MHVDEWDLGYNLYDKPFTITAGKGILVYIMGSSATKTFKVVKKLVSLK